MKEVLDPATVANYGALIVFFSVMMALLVWLVRHHINQSRVERAENIKMMIDREEHGQARSERMYNSLLTATSDSVKVLENVAGALDGVSKSQDNMAAVLNQKIEAVHQLTTIVGERLPPPQPQSARVEGLVDPDGMITAPPGRSKRLRSVAKA